MKIGWERFGINKYGFGFYEIKEPIILSNFPVNKEQFPDAGDTTVFRFGYTSFFYERLWYEDHRWELSTPFHLGVGTLSSNYVDTLGVHKPYFLGSSWMIEVSAVAQYRVVRWFAVGLGGGYRALLTSDKGAKRAMNGPVFILQFKVLMGQLLKMTFAPKKLVPWKPEKEKESEQKEN